MKNNYLLTLLFFLLSLGTARAEWNIVKGKPYYITCNYATGWLGLGAYQGSGYPLLYQTSGAAMTDDAWWLITPDGEGYTMQNSLTNEYLSWSDDYSIRNLDLTTQVTDDRQRWTLEEGGDGIVIRSLYNSTYYLNTRTSSTHFVALYGQGTPGSNSFFHFFDKNGNEVTSDGGSGAIYVESITLSGKNTMIVGEVQQITSTVAPDDAYNHSINWASGNLDIATIDDNGRVTALSAGTVTITATANDGGGATATLDITVSEPYMPHGPEMLYLRHFDSLTTVIPKDYVSEYELTKKHFTATLVNGETVDLKNIMEVTEATPKDIPAFSSYKFNNKYNPQVFTDAIAADPTTDVINLSVAGIGKWLTASFQTADEYTRVEVDGKLQRSKRTRQSFATPVTYQITNPKWQTIRLRKQDNGSYKMEEADFVREQTVRVTFTTDNSTNCTRYETQKYFLRRFN